MMTLIFPPRKLLESVKTALRAVFLNAGHTLELSGEVLKT